MDEDTLARPQVGHVEQHHVGGQVVDGQGSGFLEAHALRHEVGVEGWCDNHFLPQATAHHHDDTIPHLRREEERGRSDKAKLLTTAYLF